MAKKSCVAASLALRTHFLRFVLFFIVIPGLALLCLICHPVQILSWPLSPDGGVSSALLFVGLEIKYGETEIFSESFKTHLSFLSRNWRPFESMEVGEFLPLF